MSEGEDECCWLCLGEGKPGGAPLRQRCGCPRKSHAECLALWQLHSAGRRCAPDRRRGPCLRAEAQQTPYMLSHPCSAKLTCWCGMSQGGDALQLLPAAAPGLAARVPGPAACAARDDGASQSHPATARPHWCLRRLPIRTWLIHEVCMHPQFGLLMICSGTATVAQQCIVLHCSVTAGHWPHCSATGIGADTNPLLARFCTAAARSASGSCRVPRGCASSAKTCAPRAA